MSLSMFIETPCVFTIEEHTGPYTIPCEVGPKKFLHINAVLSENQQAQLLKVLKKQAGSFTWEYTDMEGINPNTCIHHIYMDPSMSPIRKPQRRMNPAPKDIVKEELQKLLTAGFIYPISDSKWVSPLVVVPKKVKGNEAFLLILGN